MQNEKEKKNDKKKKIINRFLTSLHHFEMFPENVAQERRRLGHEPFASHVAQVPALPGVQRLVVAARRRYQLVVRFVVVLQVLVRGRVQVVVVVAARRRLAAAVVVGAADAAATASHAIPDHLTAAAHDRGRGVLGRAGGRGELLELRSAANDPAEQRRGRWLGHGELAVSPPEPVRGLRFRPESGICGANGYRKRTVNINISMKKKNRKASRRRCMFTFPMNTHTLNNNACIYAIDTYKYFFVKSVRLNASKVFYT